MTEEYKRRRDGRIWSDELQLWVRPERLPWNAAETTQQPTFVEAIEQGGKITKISVSDNAGGQEPEHVCGLQGYNPAIDPPCPACVAHGRVPPAPDDLVKRLIELAGIIGDDAHAYLVADAADRIEADQRRIAELENAYWDQRAIAEKAEREKAELVYEATRQKSRAIDAEQRAEKAEAALRESGKNIPT